MLRFFTHFRKSHVLVKLLYLCASTYVIVQPIKHGRMSERSWVRICRDDFRFCFQDGVSSSASNPGSSGPCLQKLDLSWNTLTRIEDNFFGVFSCGAINKLNLQNSGLQSIHEGSNNSSRVFEIFG